MVQDFARIFNISNLLTSSIKPFLYSQSNKSFLFLYFVKFYI